MVKNLPASAGDARDMGSIPGSGRFPRRRKWQLAPVFLIGKFHGQRSPASYSLWDPWDCKELDMNRRLSMPTVCLRYKNKYRGDNISPYIL